MAAFARLDAGLAALGERAKGGGGGGRNGSRRSRRLRANGELVGLI